MVNVMKGVLIECDPAMKQFLLHLDEKVSLCPIADNRVYAESNPRDSRFDVFNYLINRTLF